MPQLVLFHGCYHDASGNWPYDPTHCPECLGLPEEVAHVKQVGTWGFLARQANKAPPSSAGVLRGQLCPPPGLLRGQPCPPRVCRRWPTALRCWQWSPRTAAATAAASAPPPTR